MKLFALLIALLVASPASAQVGTSGTVDLAAQQSIENAVFNRILREMQELHLIRQRQLEWQVWAFGTVITLVAGVGVLLGYSRVRDIGSSIEEKLSRLATTAAKEEFRAIQDQIREAHREIKEAEVEQKLSTRFFDFKLLARDIAQSSSFTRQNEDQALRYVEEFRDRIRQGELPEALPVLHELTTSLFSAGRWEQLQKLEEWFQEIVYSDHHLRNIMIQAYIYRAFHHDPSSEDIERARAVFRAAWDARYGETALSGELLLLAATAPDEPAFRAELERFLRRADDFNEREMVHFLNSMGRYLKAELIAQKPMAVHRDIEAAASRVLNAGKEKFEALCQRADMGFARMTDAVGFQHLMTALDERAASPSTTH